MWNSIYNWLLYIVLCSFKPVSFTFSSSLVFTVLKGARTPGTPHRHLTFNGTGDLAELGHFRNGAFAELVLHWSRGCANGEPNIRQFCFSLSVKSHLLVVFFHQLLAQRRGDCPGRWLLDAAFGLCLFHNFTFFAWDWVTDWVSGCFGCLLPVSNLNSSCYSNPPFWPWTLATKTPRKTAAPFKPYKVPVYFDQLVVKP